MTCPHCRRKVRLCHKSETVSLLWDSLTFVRQSHFSAIVWTGLYTVCDKNNLKRTFPVSGRQLLEQSSTTMTSAPYRLQYSESVVKHFFVACHVLSGLSYLTCSLLFSTGLSDSCYLGHTKNLDADDDDKVNFPVPKRQVRRNQYPPEHLSYYQRSACFQLALTEPSDTQAHAVCERRTLSVIAPVWQLLRQWITLSRMHR